MLMVACGQWRWLWVAGGNGGGWGFGFAYCSSESLDDRFARFFFFFLGSGMYYFIVLHILFYCDVYIVLLC